jgi:hypothetical protein
LGPTSADYAPERYRADEIRNPDMDGALINGVSVADLRIEAYASDNMKDRQSYGWHVRYRDCYSIDAARAGHMAQTLARLDKRLNAMNEAEGRPEDFAGYVVRVARALGITQYVAQRGEGHGTFYGDNDYRHMDGGAAVSLLRSWERAYVEQGQPQSAVV